MTDNQKTTIPTENTGNTTNSETGNDFILDFSDSSPQETIQNEPTIPEETTILTKDFSPNNDIQSGEPIEDVLSPDLSESKPTENIQSPDLSESKPTEDIQSPNLSESKPIEDIQSPDLSESKNVEDVLSPDLSESKPTEEKIADNSLTENSTENQIGDSNSFTKNLSNIQPDEPINNEIPLGKFEDEPSNTKIDNEQINSISNSGINSLPLEQPTINENPLSENLINTNLQNQENKLTQKEKLIQLIKTHESKAERSGFTKGILSGIISTIIVVLAGFILAKNQIINFFDKNNNESLSANVIDITNTTNEEIVNNSEELIIENEEMIDENEEIIDEKTSSEDESINENEEIIDENENIDEDELYDEEFFNNEIYNDEMNIDDENIDDIELDEDTELNEDNETNRYTITHVDSEKEANWVLPAHCSDLTCYGKDKEFTPCTTFRLATNLDENANRIGKNGTCKYKDSSELVFVEFN